MTFDVTSPITPADAVSYLSGMYGARSLARTVLRDAPGLSASDLLDELTVHLAVHEAELDRRGLLVHPMGDCRWCRRPLVETHGGRLVHALPDGRAGMRGCKAALLEYDRAAWHRGAPELGRRQATRS